MPSPMMRRALDTVLSGGTSIIYNDTFSTDLAAGSVHNSVLSNGIPRLANDGGSRLTVSSGNLVATGGAGFYGDPALVHFWAFTRLAGAVWECEITHGAAAANLLFGMGGAWNDTFTTHAFQCAANGRLYPKIASSNGTDVAYSTNTSYLYRIVLKAAGAKYYRSADNGATWTLLHDDSTITKQGLTCGVWGHTQAFTSSYVKLTAPRQIKRIAVVGDSITSISGNRNWNYHMAENWTKGFWGWINHAVAGRKIMDAVNGLDAQVTAMATDRANAALLCLGVNDLNGGDMETLQAKVEANIVTVKSYGTKPIYIGPVKCWTDNTGAVEQDKSLIRAAIVAACAAQSCDHISTYDCPDYVASETADGVHPLLAGAQKLEAHIRPQVEALL